jgi:predicted ATP-dependent Lon-type protease
VEQYEGPNFEYVDPREGKGKGATHVQTGGVQSIKTVTKEPEIKADNPEKVLEYLRDRYRMLFDAEADKRLGIPRLRTLVKAEEQRREEAEKAKSQAKNQDDEDEYEDYDEEEYEEDVEEDTEEE